MHFSVRGQSLAISAKQTVVANADAGQPHHAVHQATPRPRKDSSTTSTATTPTVSCSPPPEKMVPPDQVEGWLAEIESSGTVEPYSPKRKLAAFVNSAEHQKFTRVYAKVVEFVFPKWYSSDCHGDIKQSSSHGKPRKDGTPRPKLLCDVCKKIPLNGRDLDQHESLGHHHSLACGNTNCSLTNSTLWLSLVQD